MKILDKLHANGHKNVLCTHKTTIEITKDDFLTLKGNCILGINATKGTIDLNPILKAEIKAGKKIDVKIKTENIEDRFYGYGNAGLSLTDEKDMVFRKSDFLCERTVLINCSKSSLELKRDLIRQLTTPNKKFTIIFSIED